MEKIKVLLLLIALSLAPLNGASAELANEGCEEIDLRDVLGPPLDQGATGHCFAHSSADLIAAATGRRVSPLHLATSYVLANPTTVRKSPDRELQDYLTDHPTFVIDWRKDRNDEPENFRPEKILTDEGIYWTGGEELQTIFIANVFGLCDQDRLPAGETNYATYLREINVYHRSRLGRNDFSNEERTQPIGEVRELEARLAANSFQRWVNQKCGRRWQPSRALLPDTLRFAKSLKEFQERQSVLGIDPEKVREQLFAKIDTLLSERKVISIGYSSNDIMKRSRDFPSGEHASVIAARRPKNGRCYYFVRNSFGDTSSEYLAPFRRTYEQGGVWVQAKDLKSIYSAVWIR